MLRRLHWLLFALAGLLLILPFLVNGVAGNLLPVTPTVQAAGSQLGSSESACTTNSVHTPSFGGTITVDPNEVLCGELTAFSGTVEIKGEIHGNIITFNSNIVIDGGVIGDITLFGGTISLHSGSYVHGNINLYGGTEYRDKGVQLDGIVNDHTRHPWLFADRPGFGFPFWFISILVPLGLLFTWLLPEHVMFVRTTVTDKMKRSLLIGLISVVLAPAMLIVLIALIISIPLALIILLGLLAAWALGMVAIGWIIGEQIMRVLAPQHSTRYLQVVVGLIALALLSSLPYIGWLISIGAGLLGLGAVFLSRFGTRLYSQPRQPLTL